MRYYLLYIAMILSFGAKAATEHYFRFKCSDKNKMQNITRIISVDNVKNGYVYAYANEEELIKFKTFNIDCELLPHPGIIDPSELNMMDEYQKFRGEWNFYPTYDVYVQMMNEYQTNHPEMCQIIDIGNTVKDRKLLAARLTAPNNQPKPEILMISTMHGDETTGYVLMLRLIDFLLSNYGTDPEITNILDNNILYINPLHNPDGTYNSGNNTVNGAIRYNANYKDLNRNYPDPVLGATPGGARQPETQAFMNFADAHNFTLSFNLHGGVEVVNYPWDHKYKRHADDTWYKNISRGFVNLAQANGPRNYFTDLDNGITNGYDWYETTGSRQDYMVYYKHCREITIEISTTKLVSASSLPNYWTYLKDSFIYFMKQTSGGIRGQITDFYSGNPVKAMLTIVDHDADSSQIYSNKSDGWYYRPISNGTYKLSFSAPGYLPEVIANVNITDANAYQPVIIDVKMKPEVLQQVENPVISFNGLKSGDDIYIKQAEATITCPTEGAYIYYKIGTGTEFFRYENQKLTINTTNEITVYAEKENFQKSNVINKNIWIIEPTTAQIPYGPYNFDSPGTLSGWGTYNISGPNQWTKATDGSKGITMKSENGIAEEDWLISPLIYLGVYNNPTIMFEGKLDETVEKVLYSSFYDGYSKPSASQWKAADNVGFHVKSDTGNPHWFRVYSSDRLPFYVAIVYKSSDQIADNEINIEDIGINYVIGGIENHPSDNLISYFNSEKIVFNKNITTEITIIDISGRIIEKGQINDTDTYNFNSDYKRGIYIISINLDGKISSSKIIL